MRTNTFLPCRVRASVVTVCLIVALCAPPVRAVEPFTQIMTTGATAWGDRNNDGWSDMFGSSTVYTNNQAGGFIYGNHSASGYISLGDYNNDGWLDVMGYLPGESGNQVSLATNNSGTTWTNNTSKFLPASEYPLIGRSATWGDFTGDGYLDAYLSGWCNPWLGPPEDDVIYTSSAGNTFAQTWKSSDAASNSYGRGLTTVDFDRDGDLDIYASNYWLSSNHLWRNDGFNGSTGYTDVAQSYGATTPNYQSDYGHGYGSAVGDFNNDGDFDIYASNFAHMEGPSGRDNPQSRFLENQGQAGSYHFTDKGPCGVTQIEPFGSAAAADFDNDGHLDVFIATVGGYADSGQTRLYRNNGDWTFTDVSADYGVSTLGEGDQAAWGDYNNDGFLDLLTAGKLWKNPGADNWADNHYLKVKLIGGQGANGLVNGAAIGAQVRITVPGLGTLSRQIAGNTGAGNQNDLTLHFGLGSYSGPVDLEIFWPDGTEQIVAGVAVDRLETVTIVVPEPVTLLTVVLGAAAALRRRRTTR